RKQLASPEQFYGLLPIAHNPETPFLAPIVQAFRADAGDKPIIRTTDEQWTPPDGTRWPVDAGMRALVETQLPGMAPARLSQELREFLKIQTFRTADLLTHLKQTVPD